MKTIQPTQQLARRLLVFIVLIEGALLPFLIWAVLRSRGYDLLNLVANPYALLPFISGLVDLSLLALLNRAQRQVPATLWFSLFLICTASWGLVEGLSRISLTAEQESFWRLAVNVIVPFIPSTFLMFALHYTGNEERASRLSTYAALFGSSVVAIFLNAGTSLFIYLDPRLYVPRVWGYSAVPAPYYFIYIGWIDLLLFIGLALLYSFYRQTPNPDFRKQTRLFLLALAFPLLGGSLTDGILPIVLHTANIPPTATLLSAIMSVLITYGILRYGLFTLSPASVATTVLDTMDEAVLVTSTNYRIEFVNAGAEQLLGRSQAELRGTGLQDALGKQLFQTIVKTVMPALRKQAMAGLEEGVLLNAQGEQVPVSLSANTVRNERGQLAGHLFVLTDITPLKISYQRLAKKQEELREEKRGVERKVQERTRELVEAQAQLLASINSLSVGFLLADHEGKVILANQTLSRILDRPVSRLSLTELGKRLGPEARFEAYRERCQKEKRTLTIKEINLDQLVLRAILAPVLSERDECLGIVVLLEDITEATLLDRSKDEFLSIASHELRTPLIAIRGYGSMMTELYPEDDRISRMAGNIEQSAARLLEIVNQFLVISQLEQGKLSFRPEPTDLRELVQQVAADLEPLSRQKGLALTLELPARLPKAMADAARLKEILANLLGNAVKFTEQGSVTLRLSQQDGQVRLDVADTGIGIAAKNQKLLFHKFQQATDTPLTRQSMPSSGLGLYISRLMAEAMGGQLFLAESEEGKGSTFSLLLPVTS